MADVRLGRVGDEPPGRRARFYRLTRAGRGQLKSESDEWERVSGAIARALQTS